MLIDTLSDILSRNVLVVTKRIRSLKSVFLDLSSGTVLSKLQRGIWAHNLLYYKEHGGII